MSMFEEILAKLEIRETNSLYDHEQVITKSLIKLKEGMLNIGQLVDPLIIDKKTGVVLDGNHRLNVLKIIECPLAACQVVDYESSEIKVGTWYPTLKINIEELQKLDSVRFEKVDEKTGKEAVDNLRAPLFAMLPEGEGLLLNPGKYKIKEMVEEQRYLLGLLDTKQPSYLPLEELNQRKNAGYTIFYRRSYTKEEIIKFALEHSPLPPKSTRHLIPWRIIRLNMKLGWLNSDKQTAWNEMKSMLEKRAYNWNVRKYYEPVIVIY
ncbi:MAG: hypothetical protein QW153_01875 [Candidatus Bilamarchaeaceae archaeon]